MRTFNFTKTALALALVAGGVAGMTGFAQSAKAEVITTNYAIDLLWQGSGNLSDALDANGLPAYQDNAFGNNPDSSIFDPNDLWLVGSVTYNTSNPISVPANQGGTVYAITSFTGTLYAGVSGLDLGNGITPTPPLVTATFTIGTESLNSATNPAEPGDIVFGPVGKPDNDVVLVDIGGGQSLLGINSYGWALNVDTPDNGLPPSVDGLNLSDFGFQTDIAGDIINQVGLYFNSLNPAYLHQDGLQYDITSDETDGNPFGTGLAVLYSEVAYVPEPGSLVLIGAGLLGLGWVRRRKAAV